MHESHEFESWIPVIWTYIPNFSKFIIKTIVTDIIFTFFSDDTTMKVSVTNRSYVTYAASSHIAIVFKFVLMR